MTAVFRQAEVVPVCEPGELGSDLVAFSEGRGNRQREAFRDLARDLALNAADVLEMKHHPFADRAFHRATMATSPVDMLMVWHANSRWSASM